MDTTQFQQKLEAMAKECGFEVHTVTLWAAGPVQVWGMDGDRVTHAAAPTTIEIKLQGYDVKKLLTGR